MLDEPPIRLTLQIGVDDAEMIAKIFGGARQATRLRVFIAFVTSRKTIR